MVAREQARHQPEPRDLGDADDVSGRGGRVGVLERGHGLVQLAQPAPAEALAGREHERRDSNGRGLGRRPQKGVEDLGRRARDGPAGACAKGRQLGHDQHSALEVGRDRGGDRGRRPGPADRRVRLVEPRLGRANVGAGHVDGATAEVSDEADAKRQHPGGEVGLVPAVVAAGHAGDDGPAARRRVRPGDPELGQLAGLVGLEPAGPERPGTQHLPNRWGKK